MKKYEKLETLKNFNNICLIAHVEPDTDAIASMVVLRKFLLNKFNIKNVDIFAEGNVDNEYFKPLLNDIEINKPSNTYDCAIMMDCPNTDRLGIYKNLFETTKNKVVIDHHTTNDLSGNINIVEFVSSTCEIVYNILEEFDFEFSIDDKGKIYAGIITDTNNFTVGNIGQRTFEIVSKIVENINNSAIYRHFLEKNTLKYMKTLGLAIKNLKIYDNGKILFTSISHFASKIHKIQPDDYIGIINYLATISGCIFVCFVESKNNSYYVSMRAKPNYDVSNLAKMNGGGGHNGAAAFVSYSSIRKIKNIVLNNFKQQLKANKIESENLF